MCQLSDKEKIAKRYERTYIKFKIQLLPPQWSPERVVKTCEEGKAIHPLQNTGHMIQKTPY